MKKICALFLALLVLMGCFVGCGDTEYIGELRVLEDLAIDYLGYCTDQVIIFGKDGKEYLADRNGNVLTEGYDRMECTGSDSFVVAYNMRSEILDTEDAEGEEDEDSDTVKTERSIYDFDVLDQTGKVIFSRRYEEIVTKKEKSSIVTLISTVDGEYVVSCSESRIITYTERTYCSDDSGFYDTPDTRTVKIYDLQGNCLASIENVEDVGTYFNGEFLLLMEDSCQAAVVDKNGKVIRTGFDDSMLISDVHFSVAPEKCFVNGYVMLWGNFNGKSAHLLVSDDLSTCYALDFESNWFDWMAIDSYRNNGTLMASRIMSNGTISKEYYLIDLAKCQTDEDGFCIPTMDAAVSKKPFDHVFSGRSFGRTEKNVVVYRNNQWGYLSVDGSHYKLRFDHTGYFFDGISIVIKGGKTFVIDEDFNQISQSLTGYSSVESMGGGVFCLRSEDGKYFAAVYD